VCSYDLSLSLLGCVGSLLHIGSYVPHCARLAGNRLGPTDAATAGLLAARWGNAACADAMPAAGSCAITPRAPLNRRRSAATIAIEPSRRNPGSAQRRVAHLPDCPALTV